MGDTLNSEPLYVISIAARILSCHPQTLRQYEREGLVMPSRSANRQRLYSDADIARLRKIQRLTQELGVNLAGVDIILKLLDQIAEQRAENERLHHDLEHGPRRLPAGPPEAVRVEIEVRE